MKFEPKTREELSNLLPEGQYEGYVITAEEKTSKRSGNPMIVLQVEIYDTEGSKKTITDRLILIPSMQWKLYDFCESAGLMDRYEAGELSQYDCTEKKVHCKVIQKEAEGDYPTKNEIKTYFLPKSGNPKPAPVKKAAPKNSPVSATADANGDPEIPF